MNQNRLILSVDDDFPTNLYTQLVLKEEKVTQNIITLSSGKELLSYLKDATKERPQVILLDLNMPLMNGWEVLDALKEYDTSLLESVKIFLLTSSPIVDDLDRAKQHPLIHNVLMKPLDPKKLLGYL